MTVWDVIRAKHSVRNFKPQPLPEDSIERIVDAGRRAQSGFNSQPWRYIVVTDRDKLIALSRIGRSTGHVAGSAMCIVLLTPHPNNDYWRDMFDAGQTAAYMQLAAQELGIGSCPGSVYWPEMAREILGFPEEWDLKIVISFGYPDPENHPDRPPKPGGREALETITHRNGW